jgi:hypothetical protein
MQITLAYRTLRLMHECIHRDQGNAYRANLKKVIPHIDDAYRQDEDPFRTHLGASIIGQECGRAIYYSHRWVTARNVSGQMLRLYNRGHLEEARFIALLLTIGCEIYQQDENGKQFRISHADGHVGGSGDGVLLRIPDLAPGQPALGEFKTHNQKSFDKLAGDNWRKFIEGEKGEQFTGDGVRASKFEHYVQMQVYMHRMQLTVTLYVAVNKNTDDIYCELVPLDSAFAEQFLERGRVLALTQTVPKRINKSPGFWKCRFCDHKEVCHLGAAPARNCRTCSFSHPVEGVPGGQWRCNLLQCTLTKEAQLAGCGQYTARTDFNE